MMTDEEVLACDTIIVICGMMDFEESAYANGSSHEFRKWLGDNRIVEDHFTRFPKDKEIFQRSFKKNYPELCEGRNSIIMNS